MNESELKSVEISNPIIEVATELGIKIRGSMGMCFNTQNHSDEETMTLFFNPAKNTFFCKTCNHIGGDAVDLVCQMKGWDKEQAVEWLMHRVDFDKTTRKIYYGRGRKKK